MLVLVRNALPGGREACPANDAARIHSAGLTALGLRPVWWQHLRTGAAHDPLLATEECFGARGVLAAHFATAAHCWHDALLSNLALE